MPHAKSGTVSIYFDDAGDGPPLVLIPGLGANRRSFEPLIPSLSKSHRVIAVDHRGTGRSDNPPGPYRMATMAQDVAYVIESLNVAPVSVIGLSMGGAVLQSMLIDHRDLLSAAVLVSTFPSYTSVQHAWLDGQLVIRKNTDDPYVVAAAGAPWVFSTHVTSDHERFAAALEVRGGNPEPTSYEAYAAHAEAARTFDRRAELHTVTTPTLVLVGAEDILTPVSQSIEIAQLIPGSQLVVIPRGGHGMLLEDQRRALPVISRFLADVHRGASKT